MSIRQALEALRFRLAKSYAQEARRDKIIDEDWKLAELDLNQMSNLELLEALADCEDD